VAVRAGIFLVAIVFQLCLQFPHSELHFLNFTPEFFIAIRYLSIPLSDRFVLKKGVVFRILFKDECSLGRPFFERKLLHGRNGKSLVRFFTAVFLLILARGTAALVVRMFFGSHTNKLSIIRSFLVIRRIKQKSIEHHLYISEECQPSAFCLRTYSVALSQDAIRYLIIDIC
jgi:hypothetical protein